MTGHMSVRHMFHRIGEELHATRVIAEATSWSDALATLRAKVDIQVMSHNGYREPPAVRARLLRKHAVVLRYLEGLLGDYAASYDYAAPPPPAAPTLTDHVWLCWWQGLDRAPEIVRACVASISRNVGNHPVTLVTDANYRDYVDLPGWVMDKVHAGIITRTNLSDLLRLSLLAEHGGLWLDATLFCIAPIDELVFGHPMFTIKRPDYLHASIAGGNFAGYSLACDEDHRRVFVTVRDLFLEHWRRSDFIVDYLLVDYLIAMAQRHDPYIAAAFEGVTPNNPLCDELSKCLGEPFDSARWDELSRDTSLFKLTWKQGFPAEHNGKQTFYGALLKGDLS